MASLTGCEIALPEQSLVRARRHRDSAVVVARAFGRAKDYDTHAVVQRLVARRLADRIAALALPPSPEVLEIGCGTGLLGAALIDLLPGARWTMTDIAPEMVERARQRFAGCGNICFAVMDGEAPGTTARFDLICASLAFQWFDDLDVAVKQLRGLLPICAHCKKIRDDKGYWNQIEVFIRDHSDAEFSHGLCPHCASTLYPEAFQRLEKT